MYYKKSISLGRTLYSGFQGCVPRMEYALTGTPILSDPQKSLASQLFGCFSTTSFRNLYDLNISEEELSKFNTMRPQLFKPYLTRIPN